MDKNKKQNHKDLWDKLHALGPFISGIIIAIIGGIFTYSYRNREMAVREVSAFQAYISHLKNPDERKIALAMIEYFGEGELAMKIVTTGVEGTEEFGDERMRIGLQTEPAPKDTLVSVIEDTSPKPTVRLVTRRGWIYLGDYSFESGKWRTRYFDFDSIVDPYSLVEKSLRVTTSAINVRASMPDDAARFGKVTDVLKSSSLVRILAVQPWLSTGYMWASAEYRVTMSKEG